MTPAATDSRPYRFAVQGGPFGDREALREHARQVESLGYGEFFTSDHIGAPETQGKGAMGVVDPFIPLLIASESTTKLRVGPLVLNNEFYNPALLARTAATADRLTGGRLVLGLGTGYSASEHASIGKPMLGPGPRVSRLEESITVLRSLLDAGGVNHDGEHESIHFDDIGISPIQSRVPLLVGGHGRRVVRVAGKHADIFQFTGLTHGRDGAPSPGGFALSDLVERSRWLSEAAVDRDEEVERSALVQISACGDDALPVPELVERSGLDPEVVEETPFILSGSVEQIVDKIERLRETLGITHFVVRDGAGFARVVDALTRSTWPSDRRSTLPSCRSRPIRARSGTKRRRAARNHSVDGSRATARLSLVTGAPDLGHSWRSSSILLTCPYEDSSATSI